MSRALYTQENFTQTASKSAQKALPRVLLMGKFNLTQEMFDQAIEDGDIIESTNIKGKRVYSWTMEEHVVKRGKHSKFSEEKSKQGTSRDEKYMDNLSKNWRVGLFEASSGSSGSASKPSTLAIKDVAPDERALTKKQWQDAKAQLASMMSAFDRLVQNGKKLINQMGSEMKADPLYLQLLFACSHVKSYQCLLM